MTFFSSKVTGRLGSLDLLEILTGRVACGQYDWAVRQKQASSRDSRPGFCLLWLLACRLANIDMKTMEPKEQFKVQSVCPKS